MSLNFQKEEEERFLLWVVESWYPLYKEKRQGIIARISMNRGGKNLKNAHYFSNLNKVKIWFVPPTKDETIVKINTRKRKNEFLILDERLSMETACTLEVTLSSVEEKFANLHNPKVKDIDELPDKDVLERIKEFRDNSIISNKASLYNELALSYVITIYILRHDWLLKDDPKSWFINSFQFGKDLLSINKILQVYNNEDYGFSFKGLMIILESKKNVLDSFDWIPPKWLKYLEEHLPETLHSENEKSETKDPYDAFSKDCSSLEYNGKKFLVPAMQAAVVRLLLEAHKSGSPGLRGSYILDDIGAADTSKLKDIFQKSPLWKTLVVSNRKGIYELNI